MGEDRTLRMLTGLGAARRLRARHGVDLRGRALRAAGAPWGPGPPAAPRRARPRPARSALAPHGVAGRQARPAAGRGGPVGGQQLRPGRPRRLRGCEQGPGRDAGAAAHRRRGGWAPRCGPPGEGAGGPERVADICTASLVQLNLMQSFLLLILACCGCVPTCGLRGSDTTCSYKAELQRVHQCMRMTCTGYG